MSKKYPIIAALVALLPVSAWASSVYKVTPGRVTLFDFPGQVVRLVSAPGQLASAVNENTVLIEPKNPNLPQKKHHVVVYYRVGKKLKHASLYLEVCAKAPLEYYIGSREEEHTSRKTGGVSGQHKKLLSVRQSVYGIGCENAEGVVALTAFGVKEGALYLSLFFKNKSSAELNLVPAFEYVSARGSLPFFKERVSVRAEILSQSAAIQLAPGADQQVEIVVPLQRCNRGLAMRFEDEGEGFELLLPRRKIVSAPRLKS